MKIASTHANYFLPLILFPNCIYWLGMAKQLNRDFASWVDEKSSFIIETGFKLSMVYKEYLIILSMYNLQKTFSND